jgi:hypothetical protein
MPDAVFREHANDNTEKSRKFCHVITCLYYTLSARRVVGFGGRVCGGKERMKDEL